MPEQYLAMKRKFLMEGLGDKEAKGKAARIYNAAHPSAPVGPGYDKKHGDRYKVGKQDGA